MDTDSEKTLNSGLSMPLDSRSLSLGSWTGSGHVSVDIRTRPLRHDGVVQTCSKLSWSKHYATTFYHRQQMYKMD